MKSRLTITLSKDILKNIDNIIDGKDIRNRSHAIEHLIRKSIKPYIKTAIFLAGGPPQTKKPSSITLINKRPLICLMIEHLKQFGFTNIIICAGTQLKTIKKTVGKGSSLEVNIRYIKDKRSGTAGAIKQAKKYIKGESFLVLHGDILTNINFSSFIAFHQHEDTIATMAVKPRISEKEYGKVNLQGNRITQFLGREKEKGIGIVNTGVYLFKPEIFNLIPKKTPVFFSKGVFPFLAQKDELSAFIFQGIWYDISKPKNLKQAITRWKNR